MYGKIPFSKDLIIPLMVSYSPFYFETLDYFSFSNSESDTSQPLWKAKSRAEEEGGAQHKLSKIWSYSGELAVQPAGAHVGLCPGETVTFCRYWNWEEELLMQVEEKGLFALFPVFH